MTLQEFQQSIREGIPAELPAPKAYEPEINHAPKRKDILTKEEKKLAIRNALRYFDPKHHAVLAPEFAEELEKYGRIYMYRFRPDYKMYAHNINDYPHKSLQAAGIMLIVAATQAFGWVLTRAGIPQMVAEGFTSVISSPTVFMFAVVFILIIAGCFIDAVPALLIFAPILIPTATQYGISLIHFGVVMVVTLCIGLVTPPVGINLFVASSVGGHARGNCTKRGAWI